jgi:hypothetical protein
MTVVLMRRTARPVLVLRQRRKSTVGTELKRPPLEKEKETASGATLRLWVAILPTIVAIWFAAFLPKP